MAEQRGRKSTDLFSAPPAGDLQLHTVFLIHGTWKKSMSEFALKVLLAEAINHCNTGKKTVELAGYCITRQRLCLVFSGAEKEVHHWLVKFYQQVRSRLSAQSDYFSGTPAGKNKLLSEAEALFKLPHNQFSFLNMALLQFITGRNPKLPYLNPHIETLKLYLNRCPFCSVMDYRGAIGPVGIWKPDWTKYQHVRDIIINGQAHVSAH